MKKRYFVGTTVYWFCNVDVEAESNEEAVRIVKEMSYDEHNLKASLSSVEIEVEGEAFLVNGDIEEMTLVELESQIDSNEFSLAARDFDQVNEDYWENLYNRTEQMKKRVQEMKKSDDRC